MIEVTNLTKAYGETLAVDNLSFTVQPGIVTGFLGPNGAGKSTTMRMILGLDAPTSGTATVGGRALADHAAPQNHTSSPHPKSVLLRPRHRYLLTMSTLPDICSGLPVNPLPKNNGRNESIAHAPHRNHGLNLDEKRV